MCIREQRDDPSTPYTRHMPFDTLAINAVAGIFAVGTAALIWLRRKSLQTAQVHAVRPRLAVVARPKETRHNVSESVQVVLR